MKSRNRPPSPVDFGANAQDAGKADPKPANAPEPPQLAVVEPKPASPAPDPAWAALPTQPAEVARGWPVWLVAFVASALWALAPLAYAVGYRRGVAPLTDDLFGLVVFALLAIGPIALVWIAAVLVRQSQALNAEGRRMRGLAGQLLEPAALAGASAASVVDQVRDQIAEASKAAERAQADLKRLQQVLAEETQALMGTAGETARRATELTQTFGRERDEMAALSSVLDAKAVAVTEAIGLQTRTITDVSDLADTQLREAQAMLTARAADLTAAAGEAQEAARAAADDLTRQISRLESAGSGVADQMGQVELALAEQRAALSTTAQAFLRDHEALAARTESHTAKLAEFIGDARTGADEMGEAAGKGADALRQLVAEAAEQFRELSAAARAESEGFGQAAGQSLDAVAEIAAVEREKLEAQTRAAIEALRQASEETRAAAAAHAEAARAAAEAHAEAARVQVEQLSEATAAAGATADAAFAAQLERARAQIQELGAAAAAASDSTNQAFAAQLEQARAQVDQLSEATFAAGQNANKAFEARLGEARDLIAASTQMVEEAGQRTAAKLDAGAASARETLQELEKLMADMAERAERMPGQAQAQVAEVRAAVAASMTDLMTAARRTAEETQAIDAAFQERVRRNYEMLSEAVRMMGVVAGATANNLNLPSERPVPRRSTPMAPPLAPAPSDDLAAPAPPSSPPEPAASIALRGAQEPERPRLKLTPTATDAEFSTVFESAGGRVANDKEGEEGWSWGDLLSSMDGEDDDARTRRRLAEELQALGVDAQALLPADKVVEIAVVVQAAETEGAREVTRQLAPAAVRRLARRLSVEPALKLLAARYLQGFGQELDAAAERDHGGAAVAQLLEGEGGRLYLLFDAAIGEA
ncbi:MAG: polar localization protein TipN [Caulobacteraceae bacterium]|nr:polar localization protein TipN [Caulobacteraceae bacterium]